ncbi:MAG: hypothetical protein CMJ58_23105 [Planctomycetaceae bacterium]|nr:hypothetical protein [Planctomycetaceae bacterium]
MTNSLGRPLLAAFVLARWALGASAVANPVATHVVHISVDGLRGDLLAANLASAPTDYPNFKRFVDEGATTFNARTDYFNVQTLPNHATMITGRPVERPSGASAVTHHGYSSDGTPTASTTLHNAGNPALDYVVSVFDVVHDNGMSTGLYASKSKFALFEQSYGPTTGAVDATGVDNGRDKIDAHWIQTSPIAAQQAYLVDMATEAFNYSFLHYSLLDGVGHNAGWESDSWNSALQFVDGDLGDVLALIESHAVLAGDTIVILTSDHGGTGVGHGTPAAAANYTIPLLVWGPGVAQGADLYALNPRSRLDPGAGRPDYSQLTQPVRSGDSGNLALDLLGLGPIVGSTINSRQDLLVAAAFAADFDQNQTVDAADLALWNAGYGRTGPVAKSDGDANWDGAVDAKDFLQWQREHGSQLSAACAAANVPEQPCIALALAGVASLVLSAWCRSSARRA